MDSKPFSPTIFTNPSGNALLIFLAGLLFGGAFFLNSIAQPGAINIFLLLLPLAISALLSAALGYIVIPILQKLKAGQVIREDGPANHLKKAGTPTMGGIFFVPVAAIVALIWSGFSENIVALSLVTLAYGTIGFLDDWQILLKKSNKGISPKMKLGLQILVAVGFCLWLFWRAPADLTTVNLPGKIVLPLGLFFWLLAGFVLTAESNATNLTDGVDGLAGGTGAVAFCALGIIVGYNYPDIMVFCACFSGACLGFVLHNRNPAKVFMGDTGSLALGGALGAVGLLSNHLWELFIISGIFFAESLSVIAQVTYYKATKGPDGQGKRLFKMAPLHHHLELSGQTETQIVGIFYLINFALGVLAVIFPA